jgi:hypothetical protein
MVMDTSFFGNVMAGVPVVWDNREQNVVLRFSIRFWQCFGHDSIGNDISC